MSPNSPLDTISPNRRPNEGQAFILAALTIALLVALCGCAAYHQRQEDKKDQRALERVLGKDALTAKVVQRNGGAGVEEKTTVTTRTDSGTAKHTNPAPADTSCNELRRYVNSLVFATDTALTYKFGRGIWVTIGAHGVSAWSTQVDTVKVIKDNREGLRWRDSLDVERKRTIALNEQLRQAQAQVATAEAQNSKLQQIIAQLEKNLQAVKKKTGWPWWTFTLIGLVVGALGTATVLQKALPIVLIIKGLTAIIGLFKKKS